jgi:hypothetical protein
MIKEMAFSFNKRHYFMEESKVSEWMYSPKDTYISLYDYDEDVKLYVEKHKKLSGYDGLIYMPEEFLLDIDGSLPERARDKVIGLTLLLDDLHIPYNIYFSGTGFHVGIPGTAFKWKPEKNLHMKVKNALNKAGIFEYADPSVTDKTRIIRLLNTRNSKSGLWKICIAKSELDDMEALLEKAKTSSDNLPIDHECEPVFDVTTLSKKKENTQVLTRDLGRVPDPVNYPCINSMLEGCTYGSRHQTALRIAAHLRWTYNESLVRLIMEDWRQKVTMDDKPFTNKEMESIIESSYNGHNGNGNRYGCNDLYMDKHCKNTCRLYKSKVGDTLMDPSQMETHLANFYSNDQNGINLGALYGKDFPIYPGELVIIQAPPKSMKTMLLMNWVNSFKRPTYFMEMEMSPKQMWERFTMIETGWDENQVREHYKQSKNGVSGKFDWLINVDFESCYSYELHKRISTLPKKPEIIVVDHMGLLRSKHRDNNMKVEEASQGLLELAVKSNVIVFAISEITKQAFHEGMDLASSKGSFRTAYNANKVISVKPNKGRDGLIQSLHIKSEANREKETLNVKLWVDGIQLNKVEKAAYEEQVFN